MNTLDLLNKYEELTEEWMNKYVDLDNYVEQWLNGEIQITSDEIQQFVDKENEQIEQLKIAAAGILQDYSKIIKEEVMRKSAKISVKHHFSISPDEVIITGGVLSSNANESHLVGREKNEEELECERSQLLNNIKLKVMTKEITLAEASKLVQDVNIAYGISTQLDNDIKQDGIKR